MDWKNRNKESRKHLGNHDFFIMIAISSKGGNKMIDDGLAVLVWQEWKIEWYI